MGAVCHAFHTQLVYLLGLLQLVLQSLCRFRVICVLLVVQCAFVCVAVLCVLCVLCALCLLCVHCVLYTCVTCVSSLLRHGTCVTL